MDQTLELYPGIRVRILRFYLSSGIIETLVTNDFRQDKESFRKLYSLRWPVEEAYKLIKNKVGLTCFRGYSENSILQEFWVALLLTNIANVIKLETDGIIQQETELSGKDLKNKYKTNMNELAGALSRYLPDYMDADSPKERYSVIKHIFNFLIKHRIVDRKDSGESNPRNVPRNVKNHYNTRYTH